ncbi:DUF1501 domain-containing protein [Gimesia sp.]|uniref:DUF1501 domain-containing protein n=1 Tax=Gimesia sp. TaxID=2024833 RepID=UPI0032EF55CD
MTEMTTGGMCAPHLLNRRQAMQIGVGLFGLNLPQLLQAKQSDGKESGKQDISCIFIFLAGGPSHFETFDPKPEAPAEIRGPWKPIDTNVPGIQICEKLPLLAQRMDKVALIRSWQGKSGSHSTGSQHVASGFKPTGKQYFPNFGCLVSALYGSRVPGVPPHLGLPVAARYTDPPGYLGTAFSAFDLKGDPSKPEMELGGLNLSQVRFENRLEMLAQLENLSRLQEIQNSQFESVDKFTDEAIAMLTSGAMQKAVNLEEEPIQTRKRYGDNIYGRRVLLARRLVEAGARFVTINQAVQGGLFGNAKTNGTWDNHGWLFDSMMTFSKPPADLPKGKRWHSYSGPGNVPQLDTSLSALLDDLDERGLLDTTLVVAMGEFGRTPKINATAGRDHYPNAGSVLMAGGPVQRGTVIGATDRKGSLPSTRPWRPEDFATSIYHALGIDAHQTYFPRLARPTPVAAGELIEGLF